MYSMQLAKICIKNVNFKGLKGTQTQKIRIFVAADCLGIFSEFKGTVSLTPVANNGNNIRLQTPESELEGKNLHICFLYYPKVTKQNY